MWKGSEQITGKEQSATPDNAYEFPIIGRSGQEAASKSN
jgi:hypothetical protein